MTPRTRRIIRWSFILVFAVVAPLIIFWTAGYRWSLSKGRLERTGVIFVDSVPAGADVWLNDRLRKERTPARLTRLASGTYRLRLEKSGYRAWTGDVDVPSGGTAFLDDVVLFRQSVPTAMHEVAFTAASFSPEGRHAAFLDEQEGVAEIRVIDHERGTMRLAYRAERGTDAPFEFSWSPDGARLLIRRLYDKRPVFLIWDAARPDTLLDVRELQNGFVPVQAFWADDGKLYAADLDALYAIDTGSRALTNVGPALEDMRVSTGLAYGFSRGDDATTLLSRPLKDNGFAPVAVLPPGRYRLLEEPGGAFIARLQGSDRLIFIDPSKPPAEAVTFEARGSDAEWSADGRRALYWNALELRVFDLDRRSDQVITRLGEGMRSARWYPLGGGILFATGTGLYLADERGETGREIFPLAGFTGLEEFTISENGSIGYFAGTIGRQTGLWTMRLR